MVRHRVARDRRVAVGRQSPVEHQTGARRPGGVQDRRFRGHCGQITEHR